MLGVSHISILYTMRHNGAGGCGGIIIGVLKFRKFIEFESSYVLICFS